eukprot:TRINITY_DN681_c2_g2_i1.p1 TRINITY_DN681_c2_g2~~TRINITY_DN681_c2_g2_i1.p1  ORF type:complete len:676 (-),score=114.68 TRINITY_DN681_c2_g2_i1:94-2064(-)
MVRMLQKNTITRSELHDELESFGNELQAKLCMAVENTIKKLEQRRHSSTFRRGSYLRKSISQWQDSESEEDSEDCRSKPFEWPVMPAMDGMNDKEASDHIRAKKVDVAPKLVAHSEEAHVGANHQQNELELNGSAPLASSKSPADKDDSTSAEASFPCSNGTHALPGALPDAAEAEDSTCGATLPDEVGHDGMHAGDAHQPQDKDPSACQDLVVADASATKKSAKISQGGSRTRQSPFVAFIRGTTFDYISGCFVILNAMTLGMQTDVQARNVTDETSGIFKAVDTIFCAIFTTELVLRLLAFRSDFFRCPYVGWHLFDCLLVGMQLVDEVVSIIVLANGSSQAASASTEESAAGSPDMGALRVMRVLRLVRVMRLVRVLRLIGELRTMVLSIFGCLKALVWAMLLLFLVMYIVGIYLTQVVLDTRLTVNESEGNVSEELVKRYGSLGDTILSLYQAVTGGDDWGNFLEPLRLEVSVYLVPFFMFYVSFALLCMLNVITGVFVDSALKEAKKDKDTYVMSQVRSLFSQNDVDGNGSISWEEFSMMCETKEMQELFQDMGAEVGEAKDIFRLIDSDESNSIDPDEFVSGFSRLRGPAKALDLQMLMRETCRLEDVYSEHAKTAEKHFRRLAKIVAYVSQLQERSLRQIPREHSEEPK